MRYLIAPAVLIASMALGSAAFAATSATSAPASKPVVTAARATPTSSTQHAKRDACAQNWRAETTHNSDREAFMKACVAKG